MTRNDSTKLVSSGGPITQDNTGVEYYCTIFAVDESPLKEGLIWVGSDDGLLHLTQDGGENWSNVTPKNIPKWLMINDIIADPFQEGGCYFVGTLYKAGDFMPYVFKTSDYGKSWRNISNGIPSEHFTRAIEVDPEKQGVLYVGTESGMYISSDDGRNWRSFQLNLPIVPITDLKLKDDNLIASTQGRSLWMIDDLSVVRQAIGKDLGDVHLYKPNDSYRMGGGQNKRNKSAGLNHPNGVGVHYYLGKFDAKVDTLNLVFKDVEGNEIANYSNHSEDKSFKIEPKEGANYFNWNMRGKSASKFDGMILWWGGLAGPKMLPGDYSVELVFNSDTLSQFFNILKDPRVKYSNFELKSQFDFITSVNAKVSEAHDAIKEMRALKTQMKDAKKRFDNEKVSDAISEIDSILTKVEKELYQTKNKSRQDPLNYPIRLTNKLAHLNSLCQVGDAPPTASMFEVRDEISALIDIELAEYEELKSKRIPELNAIIKNEISDFITVPEKKK